MTGNNSITLARSLETPWCDRRATMPSRRFSSTVRSAKICRPSGTNAMPIRATSSDERLANDWPRKRTSPCVHPTMRMIAASNRRLACAVRTDHADDLARMDREAHVEQRRNRAVAARTGCGARAMPGRSRRGRSSEIGLGHSRDGCGSRPGVPSAKVIP